MKWTWVWALWLLLTVVSTGAVAMPTAVADSAKADPAATPPLTELASWGMAGYATDAGFRVTSVATEGPARTAGIQAQDLITAIDGGAVRSLDDIQQKLATVAGPTVRLDLVHVYWHMQVVVTLPPRSGQ